MNNEERKLWIILTILIAIVAFGLGGLFLYATKNPEDRALHAVRAKAASVAHEAAKGAIAIPPEAPEAAFSNAMDRFSEAVRAHPEMSGEEIVSEVNAGAAAGSAKPCPFEWLNGEAELQIQKDQAGKLSLASTVKSCTEAIERLPKLKSDSVH